MRTPTTGAVWLNLIQLISPALIRQKSPNRGLLALESYVSTVVHVQKIEAALRKVKPGISERYQKLARLHRQLTALAATLATRLRLTPSSMASNIRAGFEFNMIEASELKQEDQARIWNALNKDVNIRITYCSIYRECKKACLHEDDAE